MLEIINTEEDYREALKRFLEICNKPRCVGEEKELYLLMQLMEHYERNNNCSIS